jgi:hypothetical protein
LKLYGRNLQTAKAKSFLKIYFLPLIFVFASGLGFCQSTESQKNNDKVIVITSKENSKYGLTATLLGIIFKPDENGEPEYKIIKSIVFRDNKTGAEVEYKPTGTLPAGDFYFTEIWSPDEEYLALPIGMYEGFAIFESKDALKSVKDNNYFDTIKVKSLNSGWFWHEFEKWENGSTFSFRAGLDGDMFAFKYNVAEKELYCFTTKCEEMDIGKNIKGDVKPLKKGDIEIIKRH